MSKLLALILCLCPALALADTISFDQIFSETPYIGGIPCSNLTWNTNDYTTTAHTYTSPQSSASSDKESIQMMCAQGGGDCSCYVAYLEEKPAPDDQNFYKVIDTANTPVWIKVKSAGAKSMLELAAHSHDPYSSSKGGEIGFRTPAPLIYTDAARKKTITKDQLRTLPTEIKSHFSVKPQEIKILFTHKETKVINGHTFVRLSQDAVNDESSYPCGDTPANWKPLTVHIRDIWLPAFDEKNRINFWLSERVPC